jgi:hypothetical protein
MTLREIALFRKTREMPTKSLISKTVPISEQEFLDQDRGTSINIPVIPNDRLFHNVYGHPGEDKHLQMTKGLGTGYKAKSQSSHLKTNT